MLRTISMYSRAMKRLDKVIGDRDPMILTTLLRSRGTRAFYQVRIGADKREAANDLCGKIRREGQACLVLRNRHSILHQRFIVASLLRQHVGQPIELP